jgi:hypothetical protein
MERGLVGEEDMQCRQNFSGQSPVQKQTDSRSWWHVRRWGQRSYIKNEWQNHTEELGPSALLSKLKQIFHRVPTGVAYRADKHRQTVVDQQIVN